MNNMTLIASLLARLSQNQLALSASIEELTRWVEQRGSTEVGDNVRGTLFTLDENLVPIHQGIAELVAASTLEDLPADNEPT